MSPKNRTKYTQELQPNIKATIPLAELEVQETALRSGEQLGGTEPQNCIVNAGGIYRAKCWGHGLLRDTLALYKMCSLSQVHTARDRLFL